MISLAARIAATLGVAVVTGTGLELYSASQDTPSDLVDYQRRCTLAHAAHDTELYRRTDGRMAFTDGESWRPQFAAVEYAKRGMGITNSLHTTRLARDKNLVVEGKVTFDPTAYKLAGDIWKEVGPIFKIEPAWGGDFKSVDAVHFSCAWQGVK